MNKKIRRIFLLILALIPVAYLVLGFLVIPILVKMMVPGVVSGKIVGECKIGGFRLNPVVFSISVSDVELFSEKEERILKLEELTINVDPLSYLLEQRISVRELSVLGVDLNVVVDEDGAVNLLEAVALIDASDNELPDEESLKKEPEATKPEIPKFWVGRVQLDDIQINFTDYSYETAFEKKIEKFQVKAEDVRGDTGYTNQLEIRLETDAEERILIVCDFQLDPIVCDAKLNIENIHLPSYSAITKSIAGLEFNDGSISLGSEIKASISENQALSASVSNGTFRLQSLKSTYSAAEAIILSLEEFSVDSIEMNAELTPAVDPIANAKLNLGFQNLRTWFAADDSETALLDTESLKVHDINFDLTPLALNIGGIEIEAPEMWVERAADGQLKLLTALGISEEQASVEETTTDSEDGVTVDDSEAEQETVVVDSSEPSDSVEDPSVQPQIQVLIQRFVLSEGTVNVIDESMNPMVDFSVAPIDIEVENITLDPSQKTDATVTLVIDHQGEIKVATQTVLADPTSATEVACDIMSIPLDTFSSFASSAIGYGISEGAVSGTILCQIESNQIELDNQIQVETIRFGEIVPNFEGTAPPVKTVVALLEDSNGLIALDVPISGALDDPNFSILGVVSDVFGKLLKNAAAAPFRLATGVTGGLISQGLSAVGVEGERDHSVIDFEPGTDQITEASRESLEVVSEMLEQRPQLLLVMTGSVDPDLDIEAYKEQLLKGLLEQTPGTSRSDRIHTLYRQLFESEQIEPEASATGAVGSAPNSGEDDVALDVAAVNPPDSVPITTSKKAGFYLGNAGNSENERKSSGSFYLSGEKRKVTMREVVRVAPKKKVEVSESPSGSDPVDKVEPSTDADSPKSELSIREKIDAILTETFGKRIPFEELADKRVEALTHEFLNTYDIASNRFQIQPDRIRKGAHVYFSIQKVNERKDD